MSDVLPTRHERAVQPSGLHPSPEFHRQDLPARDIATITVEETRELPLTATASFVVQTPDVRCRVRGTLIFVPDGFPGAATSGEIVDRFWPPSAPAGYFGTTSLWLAKRDEATNGSADRLPVENLVGSIAAFRPLPDPGCMGFTFDVESCNDEVWGRFAVDARQFVGHGGKWVLRTSAVAYESMTEGEWKRVSSRFAARVLTAAVLSSAGGT